MSQLPPAVAGRAPSTEPPWTHAQVRFWWCEPRRVLCAVRKKRGARAGVPSPLPHLPFSSGLGRDRAVLAPSRARPLLRRRGHKPHRTPGTLGLCGACVPFFPCLGCRCLRLTVPFLFPFKISLINFCHSYFSVTVDSPCYLSVRRRAWWVDIYVAYWVTRIRHAGAPGRTCSNSVLPTMFPEPSCCRPLSNYDVLEPASLRGATAQRLPSRALHAPMSRGEAVIPGTCVSGPESSQGAGGGPSAVLGAGRFGLFCRPGWPAAPGSFREAGSGGVSAAPQLPAPRTAEPSRPLAPGPAPQRGAAVQFAARGAQFRGHR